MIDRIFKIEDTDLSGKIYNGDGGYVVGRTPIVGQSLTMLDGTRRDFVSSWKDTLTVVLNFLTDDEKTLLDTLLTRQMVSVTYEDAQDETVTSVMRCTSFSFSAAKIEGYWQSLTLNFEEA